MSVNGCPNECATVSYRKEEHEFALGIDSMTASISSVLITPLIAKSEELDFALRK